MKEQFIKIHGRIINLRYLVDIDFKHGCPSITKINLNNGRSSGSDSLIEIEGDHRDSIEKLIKEAQK